MRTIRSYMALVLLMALLFVLAQMPDVVRWIEAAFLVAVVGTAYVFAARAAVEAIRNLILAGWRR